jgi:hypothetical protein
MDEKSPRVIDAEFEVVRPSRWDRLWVAISYACFWMIFGLGVWKLKELIAP